VDIRKYILFSAVLTAILVQVATVASIVGPNLYGSTAQNAYNGDGTPANKFQTQEASADRNVELTKGEFDLYDKGPYHGFLSKGIGPFMFGSKVANADSDIGWMLYDFESDPVIAYWDVGLITGEFDAEDIAYIHINQNNNRTELDDIRLTKYGNHFPGSKVASDDNDINKDLIGFPAGSEMKFIDKYGSKGYDLMDPVYFHINSISPQISRLDLRLSVFANGPAGTLVDGQDPDRGLPATKLNSNLRFYNLNGNIRSDGTPLYDEQDPVYLDVSAQENHGFVVVNNIRLS